jgi:hypothetical protein
MKNCRLIVLKAFCIVLSACLFTACGNSETTATDSVHTDTAQVILSPKDSVSVPPLNSGNSDSIPELDTQAMHETLKVLDSLQLLKKK